KATETRTGKGDALWLASRGLGHYCCPRFVVSPFLEPTEEGELPYQLFLGHRGYLSTRKK
ncbi:hypothetical protein HAX54_038279, partial [Datura stramonium]|nr:hypothetical protein [Datura stramonium]